MVYGYRVALKYLASARAVGSAWEPLKVKIKTPIFEAFCFALCSIAAFSFPSRTSLPCLLFPREIWSKRSTITGGGEGKSRHRRSRRFYLFIYLFCVFGFHFTICYLAYSASITGLSLSIFHLTDCGLIRWVFGCSMFDVLPLRYLMVS